MTAKVLMVQGTGSSVGKSVIVAGLCRIFHQDGCQVAPYKSQNMALNSFVTREGKEMGRAQVVQAQAAGIDPHVDMNPVLLKPEADSRSQVVVMGKPAMTIKAAEYYRHTPALLRVALKALARLRDSYEVVVIEGAGSPAEINLREREIVNMRIALQARAPVLLVGDIDKGGVFASLVGTLALLEPAEKALVKGFIINKFRGDIGILQPGLRQLEHLTGLPVLGVVPYFRGFIVPEEDSVHSNVKRSPAPQSLRIAVIRLPRISNSTDFESLQQEEGVDLDYVESPSELGRPHLIILPGSKTTVADLKALRRSGLAAEIVNCARRGTPVVGICGGFQMLGRRICDTGRVESDETEALGLGLLDVTTTFAFEKTNRQARARVAVGKGLLAAMEGIEFGGYEIHMGLSRNKRATAPFTVLGGPEAGLAHPDGAISRDGMVFGTYIHGLFDDDVFRGAFLSGLRQHHGLPQVERKPFLVGEALYDRLAAELRQSLDIDRIYRILNENALAKMTNDQTIPHAPMAHHEG
ncbi:MAG: cobyric acid synthase [Chloroflexi bacterium]|nr:cobyric acid synthase [Chloroflexota bacterium]